MTEVFCIDGEVTFHAAPGALYVNGQTQTLTALRHRFLCKVLRAGGRLVTREEMKLELWGSRDVKDDTVDALVKRVRAPFGEEHADFIVTVRQGPYDDGGWYADPRRVRLESIEDSPPTAAVAPHKGLVVPGTGARFILEEVLEQPPGLQLWLARRHGVPEVIHRMFLYATDGLGVQIITQQWSEHRRLVKQLRGRPDMLARISRIYNADPDRDDEPAFLELEYGPSLASRAAEPGWLASLDEATRALMVLDVAEVVLAAHQAGVLHLDIKPHNILVDHKGGPARVKVGGFTGRCLLDAACLPATVDMQGRPHVVSHGSVRFIAPERYDEERDPVGTARGDVYSVGVLLLGVAAANLRMMPVSGWQKAVSNERLRNVIESATQYEPKDRALMTELVRELQDICASLGVGFARGPRS